LRHAVQITIVVGFNEAGEVEVGTPQIRAIGDDGGLAGALNAIVNASAAAAVTAAAVEPPRARSEKSVSRATWLAGQVQIPDNELNAALAAHTAERVAEVLEWIRGKSLKESVRSPVGLMWRVLGGR
jgi:hypothetical protein